MDEVHKTYRASRFVRESVRKAISITLDEWNNNQVRQEPQLTDRLVTRIQDQLNDRSRAGLRFTALSIPDRGAGALEHDLGADLAGIMNVRTPGYNSRKLFLAQAKAARGSLLPRREFGRLAEQCDSMLEVTPDSVVVFYTEDGIDATNANDVRQILDAALRNGTRSINVRDTFYRKPLDGYVEEVYKTWQGDEKRGPEVHNLHDLDRIVAQMRARRGLAILIEGRGR